MGTSTCVCCPLCCCLYLWWITSLFRFYSEMYSAKIRAASSTLRAQGRVL